MANIVERVGLLAQVPFFSGLEVAALEALANEASERVIGKDGCLFTQGDEALHGYVVGRGRLRLDQITSDGQNILLRYMGPGDLVGTVAVLRGIPFPATATAIEETMVYSWSTLRLSSLMERFPRISTNAMKLIGGRIEELQARLREAATQCVERRVASVLLRLASQSGRNVENGIEIPFPISRQDMAEMTATTMHTVSRILSSWDEQGIVDCRRSSHLLIRQLHQLEEISRQA